VSTVTLHFDYRFTSSLPHHVKGTIALRGLVLSKTDTWQELSTINAAVPFDGDRTTLVSTVALSGLYGLINTVSAQSGVTGATYSADIQPVVHITGTVGGRSIRDTFAPVLPFDVGPTSISLNPAIATPLPGATYVTPSSTSVLAATLNPVQSGSVPRLAANLVSVAKYQIPVTTLRVLGLTFAALAVVLALLHEVIRRRRTSRSDEEVTAARMRTLLVPVNSLALAEEPPQIEVPVFAHLARLARFLQRPILYERIGDKRTYVVDDETLRYVYRPRLGAAREDSAQNPGPPSDPRHPTRIRRFVQAGTVLVVVAVVITLSTTFTASTSVPASRVGTFTQVLQVAQLAPAGCSSLALTSLVQGSGTISNSRSNTLILGSAGADTITDTGSSNCIVAGAGANTVIGTAGDICISGPSLGVASPCPTGSPTTTTTAAPPQSNGVTVTPSSDNYNNYGAQERLAIANTSSITAMSITINVALTAGVTFNSQANSFPGGYLNQTSTTSGGTLIYSYVLGAGQVIPAGYSNGVVYAQFGGTGSPHTMSGDTWSVTSTSGGIASNLSGTF
jgi:hypothetical protein